MPAWRTISLWMDQLEEPLLPRPALEHDLDVDVAIIGAGYTGLWTAYYLKRQAPELSIAIIEAQMAGFGASGRNGGWLMGNLLGEDRLLTGPEAGITRDSIAIDWDWTDPKTAGFHAKNILWNKPTIQASIKDTSQRLKGCT